MSRKAPEPPPPPERHATVRAALEEELRKGPASCGDCGFRFEGRARLTKPGSCPRCRSTRIDPPLFSLVQRTAMPR